MLSSTSPTSSERSTALGSRPVKLRSACNLCFTAKVSHLAYIHHPRAPYANPQSCLRSNARASEVVVSAVGTPLWPVSISNPESAESRATGPNERTLGRLYRVQSTRQVHRQHARSQTCLRPLLSSTPTTTISYHGAATCTSRPR
jgi:hypothetical protein